MFRTPPTGRLKAAGNIQGFQVLYWKVKLSTVSKASFQTTAVSGEHVSLKPLA